VSFTSPKTWSFGEILTSTDMNTYVRDNSIALFGRGVQQVKQVMTTADFSTASTTPVDVTGVTISITPENAGNRILMLFIANVANSLNSRRNYYQFRRNTTDLFEEHEQFIEVQNRGYTLAMSFDESAGSTSARTYLLRTFVGSGTGIIYNSAFYVIEYAP
jgi:hypothetical protein